MNYNLIFSLETVFNIHHYHHSVVEGREEFKEVKKIDNNIFELETCKEIISTQIFKTKLIMFGSM